MSDEFDPTKTEDKTTETSGGDDDEGTIETQPLLPPPPPPPKDPYFGSHTMTRFHPERSGLPKRGPKTAETSFIEEQPSGKVMTADCLRIQTANETLKMDYPQYGKDGKLLTLEVARGKVIAVGKRGGRYPLFKADGRTINPKLLKEIMNTLGPHWTELIEVTDKEIKELDKTLQEDTRVANDENEQPSVRERARERITENTKRRTQLVQERERIVEKLPFRERLKEFFKQNGFTLATVATAVGITIGALYKILKDGASAATNGIKQVSKKVGDGFERVRQKDRLHFSRPGGRDR